MRVVLASASPRRRELLAQIVPEFDVIPSVGEEIVTAEKPQDIVTELAEQKAQSVAHKLISEDKTQASEGTEDFGEETLVIGADTIVVQDDRVLGKPADKDDAFRMLSALSGETHQVYTGVCLIRFPGDKVKTFYEKTDVTFYPMTEKEIRDYIRTGDPMDKAGAYGIQSGCARYVREIKGDYNNVVGLPIARIYHEIENFLSE